MKENNKNEESGDSGTLRMLAQPPDIPTLPGYKTGETRRIQVESLPSLSLYIARRIVNNNNIIIIMVVGRKLGPVPGHTSTFVLTARAEHHRTH